MNLSDFELTNKWHLNADANFRAIFPRLRPRRILEVGSYEGASICLMLEILQEVDSEKTYEIHAIDTWEGGAEHQPGASAEADMGEVEKRFVRNMELLGSQARCKHELFVYKDRSLHAMSFLIANDKHEYFDFIYIDGSHESADVIADAALSFELLRPGGILGFDDYLWKQPGAADINRSPKFAIDSFVNIYADKLTVIGGLPLYQLYCQKL